MPEESESKKSVEANQPQSPEELDLGQFKNPKDLLKSYKEIQGAFTRVTQENKDLKGKLAEFEEQMQLMAQPASSTTDWSPNTESQTQFYDDPDAAITQKVNQAVTLQRVTDVLEIEQEKNPGEFQERYAFAQMVAKQYPQLTTSAQGIRKLFQLGDKMRDDHTRKNMGKALESLFGEPLAEEEITKLRTLVKGEEAKSQTQISTNAFMPDTTHPGTEASTDTTAEIQKQIEERKNAGDVDGVLEGMFRAIQAEGEK